MNLDIFNQTGVWLTNQADVYLDKVKNNGHKKKDMLKLVEIKGRMEQWKRDLDKLVKEYL